MEPNDWHSVANSILFTDMYVIIFVDIKSSHIWKSLLSLTSLRQFEVIRGNISHFKPSQRYLSYVWHSSYMRIFRAWRSPTVWRLSFAPPLWSEKLSQPSAPLSHEKTSFLSYVINYYFITYHQWINRFLYTPRPDWV